MTPLRIALVTRRFWPLAGGGERVMANLAMEFAKRGHSVEIATAQWDTSWPEKIFFGPVTVTRLPQSTLPIWGTLRYMSSLGTWLDERRSRLDICYISMLKHDAFSALGTLGGSSVPVVLRPEGAGPTGDCRWQDEATFGWGIRSRCRTADAIVACSDAIAAELSAAGYPPERTVRIDNGIPVPPRIDPVERAQVRIDMRDALADLDGAPKLLDEDPLVVYTGRLHKGKGLADLIAAWQIVHARWPAAQLWLAGEGPQRDELQKQLTELELHSHIFMPGIFDDVTDLLAAADLYVLPSYEEGMSLSLLEAMACETPVLATDIPGNRPLVRPDVDGLLVPRGDARALAKGIIEALDNRERGQTMAESARNRVENEFSVTRAAEAHEELFARLLNR